jgi:hypothetical protein
MTPLRRTFVVVAAVIGISVGVGGTALANPNPNGTGPPASFGNPNITCQNIVAASGTGSLPGNAANNGGSPFSASGISGGVYNPKSEYDIACYQQAQHQ